MLAQVTDRNEIMLSTVQIKVQHITSSPQRGAVQGSSASCCVTPLTLCSQKGLLTIPPGSLEYIPQNLLYPSWFILLVSWSQHLWTIKSDNVINVFVQLLPLLSTIAPFFLVLLLAAHSQDQLFNSEGQSWVTTVTVFYVSSTEHNHCQLLFPRQSFIL